MFKNKKKNPESKPVEVSAAAHEALLTELRRTQEDLAALESREESGYAQDSEKDERIALMDRERAIDRALDNMAVAAQNEATTVQRDHQDLLSRQEQELKAVLLRQQTEREQFERENMGGPLTAQQETEAQRQAREEIARLKRLAGNNTDAPDSVRTAVN